MNIRQSRWVFSLLIVLVAAACGGHQATPTVEGPEKSAAAPPAAKASSAADNEAVAAGVSQELTGSWTLVAVDTSPIPEVGKTPTLEILDDGTVGGVSGVNRFHTQIEVSDGNITFGNTAGTKMAGPPAAMELEASFLARLGAVSAYEIDGHTLRLWADDNEALTFVRSED